MIPLKFFASTAFTLVLGATAHAVGSPIVRGGAQKLTDALSAHLLAFGGEIFLNRPVRNLKELPAAPVVLCDLTPHQFLTIAGTRPPGIYRDRLKQFLYGLGALKSIGPRLSRYHGKPQHAHGQ